MSEYRLTVDTSDLTHIAVELRLLNAPASITVAAAAHPEYDDKYWRYIDDVRVTDGAGNPVTVTRADSVLWRLGNRAGPLVVSYRLSIPVERLPRPAWKPFLTRTGGLVGGPHSFLYVLGQENAPVFVTLTVPGTWKIATALQQVRPNMFIADNLPALMESPMQIGIQSEWSFQVNNITHRVFYWRLPNAAQFDTVAFVNAREKIASGALAIFGGAPYRAYTFMYQDGAYGGLEHPSSVTLGLPSADLAKDPAAQVLETAHEFFHTWNLMHMKPSNYHTIDYRTQPPVNELWFSEGVTMFYADLLLRRAGLPASQPTRTEHLESTLARYLAIPGQSHFSAEQISRVAYNAGPGALGDYTASVHLTGEVIGAMLDFRVRAATKGAKSLDDVMRLMNQRFAARGFTSSDVQQAVEAVCACKAADIFDGHVRNGGVIDFNRYLAPLGLQATITWGPAATNGKPQPDLRLSAFNRENEDALRLQVSDPNGVWGKAGLHTHDVLLSLNGKTVKTWPEFRSTISTLSVGDTVTMTVQHEGATKAVRIPVVGYNRPFVHIEQISSASAEQKALYEAWAGGR